MLLVYNILLPFILQETSLSKKNHQNLVHSEWLNIAQEKKQDTTLNVKFNECLAIENVSLDKIKKIKEYFSNLNPHVFKNEIQNWSVNIATFKNKNDADIKKIELSKMGIENIELFQVASGWIIKVSSLHDEAIAKSVMSQLSTQGLKNLSITKEKMSDFPIIRMGPWPNDQMQELENTFKIWGNVNVKACTEQEKNDWRKMNEKT